MFCIPIPWSSLVRFRSHKKLNAMCNDFHGYSRNPVLHFSRIPLSSSGTLSLCPYLVNYFVLKKHLKLLWYTSITKPDA